MAYDDVDLFARSCPEERRQAKQVLQSACEDINFRLVKATRNAFFASLVAQRDLKHNLNLDQHELWFAILTQVCFYINKNAEQLRSKFVAHRGRKALGIKVSGTLYDDAENDNDIGTVAITVVKEMSKFMIDSTMKQWLLADFCDTKYCTVQALMMMAVMQKYFSYHIIYDSSAPVQPHQSQAVEPMSMEQWIGQLEQFGAEAEDFAKQLRDIFIILVDGDEQAHIELFSRMLNYKRHPSGHRMATGWSTAFCRWDEHGECLDTVSGEPDENGMEWNAIKLIDIPKGYTVVPMTISNGGIVINAKVVAGSVGIYHLDWDRLSSAERLSMQDEYKRSSEVLDTIHPFMAWWLYECAGEDNVSDSSTPSVVGVGDDEAQINDVGSDESLSDSDAISI